MFRFRLQAQLIPLRALTVLALGLALLAAGCEKKPARAVPAVLVPTIETQPDPIAPPLSPLNKEIGEAPDSEPASAPQGDAQKPKPKPHKPVTHKPAPAPPAQPPVVVEAPKQEPPKAAAAPDSAVQITADVPRAAVQTQRQNTENLLHSSEGKLGHIARSLGESEQGMLRQAKNYIDQSNQALQAGDTERAYNLAVKASLLANELTK
jgi:outer membrane biosynthesis protein TonB